MCPPALVAAFTTYVLPALTVAAPILSIASNVQQGREMKKQADAQQQAAQAQLDSDKETLKMQSEQVDNQAVFDKGQRANEAQRERASLRVASGESGISGNLASKIMQTSLFNEGYDITSIMRNAEQQKNEIKRGLASARVRYQRTSANIQKPNWLGIGSDILGDGLQTISSINSAKAKASGSPDFS